MWLKQSTAVTVKMGPFLDSTDGNTQETLLTISQADIRLSKNGGAYAQTNNVAGATHDEKGNYGVPLDVTDTNTLGTLRVHIHETGALAVWQDFMVVTANVWDSLFGADAIQVDLTQIVGVAQSATDLKDFADDGYDPATNKVQGVVLVDTLTTYTGNTPQTGDAFLRIGAAGASLTAIPWNATWDAEVESEVNDALVVQRLDELVNADSDIDGVAPPTVGSVVHELLSKTAGSFTYDQTTDSLEAIADSESTPPTAAQIADAVWDEAKSGHTVGTSFGDLAVDLDAVLGDTNELQVDDYPTRFTTVDNYFQAILSYTATSGVVLASFALTAGKIGTDAITAAKIAADAIGASELAADAVTEIQSGLSTLTIAQVNTEVDTALADVNLDHLVGTATGRS